MQATMTTKRPGFDRITGSLVALGIVAGIAIGAVGQAVVDDSNSATRSVPAAVQLKAYTGEGQGEGRLADTHATIQQLKAHSSAGQGEGLVNPESQISGAVAASPSLDTMLYLEQNLYLPDGTSEDTTKQMIYERLLQENLDIAPMIVPDAQLWRLLEQNSWGDDFILDSPAGSPVYPSPDDVPQRHPDVVTY